MGFDEILDLTADVFLFYNKDRFDMNITTQTELSFPDRVVLFFTYLECTVRLWDKHFGVT